MQAHLSGGEWIELLEPEHPGIAEVKWCRNRFRPFLCISPQVPPRASRIKNILLLHFCRPGEATEAIRPGQSDGMWQCSPRDLTLCPAAKVMIPDDLGSLSSALEKKFGNQRVDIHNAASFLCCLAPYFAKTLLLRTALICSACSQAHLCRTTACLGRRSIRTEGSHSSTIRFGHQYHNFYRAMLCNFLASSESVIGLNRPNEAKTCL